MKRNKTILTILGIFFLFANLSLFSQQISWRMGEPRVTRISGIDWLEWAVQVKCDISGCFLAGLDDREVFNLTAFTNVSNASDIAVTKGPVYNTLDINGEPKYSTVKSFTGSGASRRLNVGIYGNPLNAGAPGGFDFFEEILTTWHTLFTVRLKIANNTLLANKYFLQSAMNGAGSYYLDGSATPYAVTNPHAFETKDMTDLYLGRIYSDKHGWTATGGTADPNWTVALNTSVWDGTGHVTHATGVCGGLRIHSWYSDHTGIAKMIVDPNMSMTASGATDINANNGIVIASDATGTGAFRDNGTISYLENGIYESWMSIYRWITDPVVGLYQHLVTAPMQPITLQFFEMANHLTYAYEYTESTNSWTNIWVPSTPMPAMKGLTLSVAKQSGDGSIGFPYKPYTGNVTINLTKSDYTGVPADDNWNLVGNPFASPIDWEIDAGWTRDNVGPTIYIWNPALGNYGTYNRVTDIGTNGVTQFIPVAQGFFVQATSNYTFGVNNSARVISTQPFLKDSPANTLRLKANGNFSSDEAVISFMDGATTAYEMDFDAPKKMSTSQDVHSIDPVSTSFFLKSSDNIPLSVYVREPSNEQVTVPAGFRFGAEGQYTITASEIETFSAATTIFIEDLKDNVWQNLKENAVYTFNAVNGDNQDRFLIHFYGPTSVNELSNQSISIYSYGKYAYIMNPAEESIQRVEVFDMQGNMVMTTKVAKTTLTKFAINHPSAYYLVKVITDRGITSEKIYIGVM